MFVRLGGVALVLLGGLFASSPSSTSYTLKAYDIGGGGGSGSSTSYKLNGISGTQNGLTNGSTTYKAPSGEIISANSNVPPAPSFTNPSSYYDRLQLIINTGGNPADTKFAIAISPDNFSSTTNYVKSDHSVGTSLAIGDYQTYTAWGGASGFFVLGLQPNTTYTVKVKAFQGNFSGSAYGPTASATTVWPSITFGVATVTNPTPPFTLNFSGLTIGSVFNANDDAKLTLTTNALSGGAIYMRDANSGLKSTSTSFTLPSASTDLSSASNGYGAIVTSATQSSGGPITAASPYNGSSNVVGALTTTLQQVASTSAAVGSANVVVRLKAKTDISVPAATDYGDTLTFVAAMLY